MKLTTTLLILFAVYNFSSAAVDTDHRFQCSLKGKVHFEQANFEIEGSTLVVTHRGHDDTVVEITSSGELYIDNRKVTLSRNQQKLLKKFNKETRELVSSAKNLGKEAGELGIEGAELGVSALAELVHVMFTEAEMDDIEYKLEKEAEKLEAKASKLEKKADKLEQRADALESMHSDIKDEIRELNDLDWF
jgi:chaperonin cofactor prefoldin